MKTVIKKSILVCSLIILGYSSLFGQNYFRSGMFLHHSTGSYIWGPNPDGTSTTTIPQQMDIYNAAHGYSGPQAVTMNEIWWDPPDNNEWYLLHRFFEGDTTFSDTMNIGYCLNNYKILVVKSCYPSSDMYVWGDPSDTLYPDMKTVYNYKWHWRHMVKVMKDHPATFFAIWTNAPLVATNTTPDAAALSRLFSRWAKDTLAANLDPVFGAFPLNAYVFDYFGKVTDANGYELVQYAIPSDDWHPNGTATDLVAPQFVQEIFNASIYYENHYNGINEMAGQNKLIIFPNPVSDRLTVILLRKANYRMFLSDLIGKILMTGEVINDNMVQTDISQLPAGSYLINMVNQVTGQQLTGKFIVAKLNQR